MANGSNNGSREASLLQKIGICFRERKEYEKSCELLERVLQARKKLFIRELQKKGKNINP